MKYYLTIVQNKITCACFVYDSEDAAKAAFHSELAYRAPERTSTLCIISNENGAIIAVDKYRAPNPDPGIITDGDA